VLSFEYKAVRHVLRDEQRVLGDREVAVGPAPAANV
jgi:hypothetical protein